MEKEEQPKEKRLTVPVVLAFVVLTGAAATATTSCGDDGSGGAGGETAEGGRGGGEPIGGEEPSEGGAIA
jgi:hypothetical protein